MPSTPSFQSKVVDRLHTARKRDCEIVLPALAHHPVQTIKKTAKGHWEVEEPSVRIFLQKGTVFLKTGCGGGFQLTLS